MIHALETYIYNEPGLPIEDSWAHLISPISISEVMDKSLFASRTMFGLESIGTIILD